MSEIEAFALETREQGLSAYRRVLSAMENFANYEPGFCDNIAPVMKAPMKLRAVVWTVTMAYSGFLLTGQGLRTFNNLSIMEGSLGALTGFLLALMFTLRERRRRRPALVAHPIAQILPNWEIPSKGGSQRNVRD